MNKAEIAKLAAKVAASKDSTDTEKARIIEALGRLADKAKS